MDKKAIFIFVLIMVFTVIFAVNFALQMGRKQDNMLADNIIIIEKNNIIEEEFIETSMEEEKTTPNTVLILKKEYTDCGHIISDKASMPEEMVNLTKEEIIKQYPNWNVEGFSKEEIILSRKLDSFCGEHYLLKDEDGYISIYTVDENGNVNLKQKTYLSIEYLTEIDKINLKEGLMVYGKENLNKLLEDYET